MEAKTLEIPTTEMSTLSLFPSGILFNAAYEGK